MRLRERNNIRGFRGWLVFLFSSFLKKNKFDLLIMLARARSLQRAAPGLSIRGVVTGDISLMRYDDVSDENSVMSMGHERCGRRRERLPYGCPYKSNIGYITRGIRTSSSSHTYTTYKHVRYYSNTSKLSQKRDYYETLGVQKNASKGDVKKAYFKLAKEFHPDTNKGDDAAAEKFKEATEVRKEKQN